ncbi:MAG: hypothetical protein KIT33_09980 [Candidatus Kapabacteria bacterium]|nr:hypothetical protein [Ignavibacteriota bacterium]MCW5885286.1 hypothetical protein [Candidatus Kapabacteria bacterium]
MKTILYISTIILFSISSLSHENRLNPINEPDVHGGYRKCTVLNIFYDNSELPHSNKMSEIIYYNENGKITEHIEFTLYNNRFLIANHIYHDSCIIKYEKSIDDDGKIFRSNFYEYCKNGELLSNISLDSTSTFEYLLMIDFEEAGYLKRELSFDNQNLIFLTHITKLNANGKKILEQIYDKSNNLKSQYAMKYDSTGNMIEYRDGIDSNDVSKSVCKYDKNGNILEEISFNSDNDTSYHTIYVHNLTENYIDIVDINGDRMRNKSRMYRDDRENITKWIFYNENDEIERINYHYYDSEYRHIGHTIMENDKIYYKLTREFDKYGNILKRTYYDNDDKIKDETLYIYEF